MNFDQTQEIFSKHNDEICCRFDIGAMQQRFDWFSDWIQKVQQLESNVGRNLENHPVAVQKLDPEVGKSVERAVQKCADLVDLENAENCAYSRYRRCRYSRERASQSLGV